MIAFRSDFGRVLWAVTTFVCMVLWPIGAGGETNGRQRPGTQQIKVAADGFQANTRENYAEFNGNVKAVQGPFEILSDRLRIYYNAENSDSKEPLLAAEKGEIREIVASGNVRIKADDRVAQTEEAVYRMESQELVLSGPNSTLSNEDNRISGSKITFNRNTRQVKIEGKDQERVSGVFYPRKNSQEIEVSHTPVRVVFLTPPPSNSRTPNRTASIAPRDQTEPAQITAENDSPPADSVDPSLQTGVSEPTITATAKAQNAETAPETVAAAIEIQKAEAAPETVAAATEVPKEESEPETVTVTSVTTAPPQEPPIPPAADTAMHTETPKMEPAVAKQAEPEGIPTATIVKAGQPHAAAASAPSENDVSIGKEALLPEAPPVSAPPLVLARAHTEPLVASSPQPPPPHQAVVPLEDLTKRVGIAPFENTTAFPEKGYGMFMLEKLAAAISEENPRVALLLPDAPNYPGIFMDLPRQASGNINNLLLVQTGRRLGLNAIITGTLTDIKIMTEPTGFWIFKGSRIIARVVVQVNVYDTETGTKILDRLLTRTIEMDEADLYAARKGQVPEIPGLEEVLAEMAQEVGETIAEKMGGQKWRGFIVAADGDRVTLSAGEGEGLRVGNELAVYDETPMDGLAGHRYFLPGQKLGTIQITAVYPDRAEARVASGDTIREGLPAADPDDDSAGESRWVRRLKFW